MPQQKEQQEPRRKGVPRVPYDPQIFEHSYDIISLRVIGKSAVTSMGHGCLHGMDPGLRPS